MGPALMVVAFVDPGLSLILALAAVGFFASLYHPSGLSLISRTITQRGTALGINGIYGTIGVAGAPLLAEFTSHAWGWRGAFFALGVFLLFLGLVVAFRRIDEPHPGKRGGKGVSP